MSALSRCFIASALCVSTLPVFAESLAFTTANGTNLPAGNVLGTSTGANACANDGICGPALSFKTTVGGKLIVTATDDGWGDPAALAIQSHRVNAGLGVVSAYQRANGSYQSLDLNQALSSRSETLTLSFQNTVSLSALYFFPDDTLLWSTGRELDSADGFTLSVDGGPAVEYSFGNLGGHPVTFSAPLVGKSFTLGYAAKKSPENFYLGALTISAVPELPASAMMALGLAGGLLAKRRRQPVA